MLVFSPGPQREEAYAGTKAALQLDCWVLARVAHSLVSLAQGQEGRRPHRLLPPFHTPLARHCSCCRVKRRSCPYSDRSAWLCCMPDVGLIAGPILWREGAVDGRGSGARGRRPLLLCRSAESPAGLRGSPVFHVQEDGSNVLQWPYGGESKRACASLCLGWRPALWRAAGPAGQAEGQVLLISPPAMSPALPGRNICYGQLQSKCKWAAILQQQLGQGLGWQWEALASRADPEHKPCGPHDITANGRELGLACRGCQRLSVKRSGGHL
ncbi:hypothetical protein SKAU_G00372870 [Synaphobranchus kaupii]|uniref:Uncharacterized protein n=1 Tax=Synaphobranchus kaupii TaxID=118154 RepID=A0A9Q1EGB8_SYNKA|nr:hypothetical protein SKAU_G00372870 [Synaphobranchus kaupii]